MFTDGAGREAWHVSAAWSEVSSPAAVMRDGTAVRLSVVLPPDELAPRRARRALDEWAGRLEPDTLQDARLLVSELVTNAVLYAGDAGDVRLDACLTSSQVVISVTDGGRGFTPRGLRGSHPGQPGGRGLELVAFLAPRFGIGSRAPFSVWFALSRARG